MPLTSSFLRASARHSSRKYGRPRAAGTYPRRWNTLIRSSTISVNRYGSIRSRIEEVSIPRSCTRKPRASTAPNRYAPASSRSGFHVAKMTSAIAESTRSHREEKMNQASDGMAELAIHDGQGDARRIATLVQHDLVCHQRVRQPLLAQRPARSEEHTSELQSP